MSGSAGTHAEPITWVTNSHTWGTTPPRVASDVFRPAGNSPFPVLVAWSPYGKTTGTAPRHTMLRDFVGVDKSKLSGLMKWEAPDSAFWCAQGYAVCNPDARCL